MEMITRVRTSTRRDGHRVQAPDGFLLGLLHRVGPTGEPGGRLWAAEVLPMAFNTTGVGRTLPELYAPVDGSPYLPGRHATMRDAHAELEAYLIEREAPALRLDQYA